MAKECNLPWVYVYDACCDNPDKIKKYKGRLSNNKLSWVLYNKHGTKIIKTMFSINATYNLNNARMAVLKNINKELSKVTKQQQYLSCKLDLLLQMEDVCELG